MLGSRLQRLLLILGSFSSAQNDYPGCDPEKCPNMGSTFSCGVVMKEYTNAQDENGENLIKCGYMITGSRSKYSELQELCKSMTPAARGSEWEAGEGTGDMISLENQIQQDILTYHVKNVTVNPNNPNSFYYPYVYIGFRRLCGTCPWFWEDGSPVSWTHWLPPSYPTTSTYANCAWSYAYGTYEGEWRNYACYSSYPGYCEYFPKGRPSPKLIPLPNPVRNGGCLAGWWKFGGYCYKQIGFSNNIWDESQYKTYDDANAQCNNLWSGATLAMVPSPQHNAMVAALLGPHTAGGKSPWIGVKSFAQNEYYFANIDQTRIYYSNWVASKPNHLHLGLENCVEMKWKPEWSYNGGAEAGQWENRNCNERRPYVCSRAEDSSIGNYVFPTDQTWANQTCPEGWIPKGAACYKFSTDKKTFDDASKYCQDAVNQEVSGAIKGDLMTFWDDYERNHAYSFFRDDSVDNRNDVTLPFFGDYGIWVGLDKRRNNTWRWIDDWPMTGTHWAPGKPQPNSVGGKDCAYINKDGYMTDESCSTPMPFICKAEFVDYTPSWRDSLSNLGEALDCPDGWTEFYDHCIKGFKEQVTWFTARQTCESSGGDLVSIHSEVKNNFVKQLYSDLKVPYPDEPGPWIGLRETPTPEWSDKSSVAFINWANGQPDDYEGNEACGQMITSGAWNDEMCDNQHPFMCQRVRTYSYCAAAAEAGKFEQCGYAGVSEEQCVKEFQCCWNPIQPVKCFAPKKPGLHPGITAGAAVAATLFTVGIVGGAYFYYTKYGFGMPGSGGIVNPAA